MIAEKFYLPKLTGALLIAAMALPAHAQVSHFGWVRADYGVGANRYGKAYGSDRLGVSQVALGIKSEHDNVTLIGVVGTSLFSNDNTPAQIGVKDAFLIWKEVGGSSFTLSVGAQPFLFGLKPNGYPGDRSLQPSLEYGQAGAFAVAQQAGLSVLVNHPLGNTGKVTFGLFDHLSKNADDTEGSTLFKNAFAQVRFDRLGVGGLYGVAGFETRYVGGTVDANKPIFTVGAGLQKRTFDISFELVRLDKSISATSDNDQYLIAELTLLPSETSKLYLDFAKAQELDARTLRAGIVRQVRKNLAAHVEVSSDKVLGSSSNVQSVDFRLTVTY